MGVMPRCYCRGAPCGYPLMIRRLYPVHPVPAFLVSLIAPRLSLLRCAILASLASGACHLWQARSAEKSDAFFIFASPCQAFSGKKLALFLCPASPISPDKICIRYIHVSLLRVPVRGAPTNPLIP